ncbi:MAG TPA: hemerythrin domain-containing protein [Acidimicrobiales bacterium]|nr:hemerythrin domain-containing protein [Acidimicrobiales bacterium]
MRKRTLNELVLDDHKRIEELLDRFDQLPRQRRAEAFRELTEALVQHEVAEEEVVYPAVRKFLVSGDELAGRRIEEQAAAEELLAQMERTVSDDVGFMQLFVNLRDAVTEHAAAEETTVLPDLARTATPDVLLQLGEQYEWAKSAAPTHPHPHLPHVPPGNLALGTVAAVIDRIRDAIRKAS